jgi:hypothetical protein
MRRHFPLNGTTPFPFLIPWSSIYLFFANFVSSFSKQKTIKTKEAYQQGLKWQTDRSVVFGIGNNAWE